MAIYHFSAKIISRAAGSSALASAAYRSASRLRDERLDRSHDFSNKAGVVHSEVLLPEGAPDHLSDRERLWNEVEATEKRIDAQLAREIEFAIPKEMAKEQPCARANVFHSRSHRDPKRRTHARANVAVSLPRSGVIGDDRSGNGMVGAYRLRVGPRNQRGTFVNSARSRGNLRRTCWRKQRSDCSKGSLAFKRIGSEVERMHV